MSIGDHKSPRLQLPLNASVSPSHLNPVGSKEAAPVNLHEIR